MKGRRLWLLMCVACVAPELAACPTPSVADPGSGTAHEDSIAENLDCGNCHTTDSWRIGNSAGSTGEGSFDHAVTGFPLTGQHDGVTCTTCHKPSESMSRECVSCHQDVHQGRLGTSCDRCHSARSFQLVDALEVHRRTLLPLTGMHVLADCTQCHQRRGERFLTNVPSDCYACHADQYRDPSVHPNHLGTATSPPFPTACEQCHRPISWSPAFIDPASLSGGLFATDDHDAFFLISAGPHRGATCETCHSAPAVPRIVQCTGCHEHNAVRLAEQHGPLNLGIGGLSAGSVCLTCHGGGAGR